MHINVLFRAHVGFNASAFLFCFFSDAPPSACALQRCSMGNLSKLYMQGRARRSWAMRVGVNALTADLPGADGATLALY